MILIAPGWPNMPWFWDLVELSSQIPLCLPNHPDLVTQPFNKARHRNLTNLNLHAWLLEPRLSKSKGSLLPNRREIPTRPSPLFSFHYLIWGRKRCYDVTSLWRVKQELGHLASGLECTGPAGGETQDVFFWRLAGPAGAGQ